VVSELAANTFEHEQFFFGSKRVCTDIFKQERDLPFESLTNDLSDFYYGRDFAQQIMQA
jgi:hypothetical protein